VAFLVLGVVQLALVVRAQVVVVEAAREAARTAAVDPDPAAPWRAVVDDTGLDPGRLTVEVTRATGRVVARVRYAQPTDVSLVGRLTPDVGLSATAAMRDER